SGPGAPTVTRESDPTLRPTVRMKVERPNATRVAVGALIGSVVLFAGLFAWRQQQSARDAAAAQAAAVKPPVSSPALDTTHLAAVTPPESTKVEPPKPVAAESTPATPAKKRATGARD